MTIISHRIKTMGTSPFMYMPLLIYTAPNDVPFFSRSGKPRPLKRKERTAHADTLWASQNSCCVLWFILNEMSIMLRPLQILYRGESQCNCNFPRPLLVLASDWLDRRRGHVHVIYTCDQCHCLRDLSFSHQYC